MRDKRLLQLFVVLLYDSNTFTQTGKNYLTAGQRICINQERGYLMRDEREYDKYPQSEAINEKIDFVLQKIRESNLTRAYVSHARENLKN